MATTESVRASIDANIKSNGKQEITGMVLNSVLHDVVDLSFNDKGKYPSVTAGFANNLVGRGEAVDATINFRASGGKSIEDGAARVKVLKGNSVVWNNKVQVSIKMLNDAIGDIRRARYTLANPTIDVHKYLIFVNLINRVSAQDTTSVNTRVFLFDSINGAEKGALANFNNNASLFSSGNQSSAFFVNGSNRFNTVIIDINQPNNSNYSEGKVVVHDLTQMFGEGNEPTTIEEFYNRIPQNVDLYAYNEGEVIHTNAEGIKSVGFNAWDGVMYEGFVDDADGNIGNLGKNTGFIRILPNTDYYIKTSAKVGQWGAWYDEQKKYISGFTGYNKVHKSPSNAAFMCCTCMYTGVDNADDFCINLAHSGYRNGEYQPYMQFIRDIDSRIREAFPNGMKSAGSAYDEVRWNGKKETWEAVQRIGEVDMGALSWSYNTSNTNARITASVSKIKAKSNSLLCEKYTTTDWNKILGTASIDKVIAQDAYGTISIGVVDSAYTDAASFKAAMSGVMLYYELAEPIVTELGNDINLDYEVWDFGTEQMLSSEPSAPIKASIVYGFNAVDSVRNAQLEIAELKTQIAQMQAIMASLTVQPAMIKE